MNSRDFCYWLRGYLEVLEGTPLSPADVAKVRKKLGEIVVHDSPWLTWGQGITTNGTGKLDHTVTY